MIVAIDGPAATGKSTSAKLIAHKLGFTYLDTGAMYRCVTLSVLRHDIDLSDSVALAQLLSDTHIEFGQKNGDVSVSLNGENVSREIRQAEVTNHVSAVSALASVREALVRIQRQIAANPIGSIPGSFRMRIELLA